MRFSACAEVLAAHLSNLSALLPTATLAPTGSMPEQVLVDYLLVNLVRLPTSTPCVLYIRNEIIDQFVGSLQ